MQKELDEKTEAGTNQPIRKIQSNNVGVATFRNESGQISYALKIGYKENDVWKDKKISIMEREIDRTISVLIARSLGVCNFAVTILNKCSSRTILLSFIFDKGAV